MQSAFTKEPIQPIESIVDLPPGLRILSPVEDRTMEDLAIAWDKYLGGIFTVPPEKAYELVFGRSFEPQRWGVSLIHQPSGVEITDPSANLYHTVIVGPGLQGTSPNVSGGRMDSRSAMLYNQDLYKGVGTRVVGNRPIDIFLQYGRMTNHKRPQIFGGVSKHLAVTEQVNSIYISLLYSCVFGEPAPVRKASNTLNIRPAIENMDGFSHSREIYQLKYPGLEHTVRNNFYEFVESPDFLFSDLDLNNESSRQTAVDRYNFLLTDWLKDAKEHNPSLSNIDIEPLTLADFESSGIFEYLQFYSEALAGFPISGGIAEYAKEAASRIANIGGQVYKKISTLGLNRSQLNLNPYSKEERQSQQFYLAAIRKKSDLLRAIFLEKNRELVTESLLWQTSRLAKIQGMAFALGINLGQAVSAKDAYGGVIADLDDFSFSTPLPEDPFAEEVTFYEFGNTYAELTHSLRSMGRMYGIQDIRFLLTKYFEVISESYFQCIEKIPKLPLTDKHVADLYKYHSNLLKQSISALKKKGPQEIKQTQKLQIFLMSTCPQFYKSIDRTAFEELENTSMTVDGFGNFFFSRK